MKTIRVSEATGAALDWLVAKCEGRDIRPGRWRGKFSSNCGVWQPSVDPAQAHKIIQREKVDVCYSVDGWYANMYWRGLDVVPAGAAGESFRCGGDGPTPLIAAMRCYAASRLGDEVEVPEGLSR